MAGLITHLYIADRIYKELKIDNKNGFWLGSIAPDTIMSRKDYQSSQKMVSHLREDISGEGWYEAESIELFKTRIREFTKEHKCDFSKVYLIHLLTDEQFHFGIRKVVVEKLKYDGLPYSGKDLLYTMLDVLDSIDNFLLISNPHLIDILSEIEKECHMYEILNIKSSYICSHFEWIRNRIEIASNVESKHVDETLIRNAIEEIIQSLLEILS